MWDSLVSTLRRNKKTNSTIPEWLGGPTLSAAALAALRGDAASIAAAGVGPSQVRTASIRALLTDAPLTDTYSLDGVVDWPSVDPVVLASDVGGKGTPVVVKCIPYSATTDHDEELAILVWAEVRALLRIRDGFGASKGALEHAVQLKGVYYHDFTTVGTNLKAADTLMADLSSEALSLSGSRVCIVTEHLDGGSLAEIMHVLRRPLTEGEIVSALKPIAATLHLLHKRGIVHRDVKADVIRIAADGTVKLTEFGSCFVVPRTLGRGNVECDSRFIGSPYWLSPEVAEVHMNPQSTVIITSKVDVWGIGVTTIELFEGAPPHKGESTAAFIGSIPLEAPQLGGQVGTPEWRRTTRWFDTYRKASPTKASDKAKAFVSLCCALDARARPLDPSRDPWLADADTSSSKTVLSALAQSAKEVAADRRAGKGQPLDKATDSENEEEAEREQLGDIVTGTVRRVPKKKAAASATIASSVSTLELPDDKERLTKTKKNRSTRKKGGGDGPKSPRGANKSPRQGGVSRAARQALKERNDADDGEASGVADAADEQPVVETA